MMDNIMLITISGETSIEVQYKMSFNDILYCDVFFNGILEKEKKVYVKDKYIYMSLPKQNLFILFNEKIQYKVEYRNSYATKGFINEGYFDFIYVGVTEEETEETTCSIDDP